MFFQRAHFALTQRTPLARLHCAQLDRTDPHANQAQNGVTDCRAHVANLPFFTFVQNDLDPGLPVIGIAKALMPRRTFDEIGAQDFAIVPDAFLQFRKRGIAGIAFDERQILFRMLKARMRDAVREVAVIRQQ